jgi:hypothetical protein
MNEMKTGAYPPPGPQNTTDYSGWIEPPGGEWILYLRHDGGAELYTNRDPKTGAIP